LRLVLLLLLIFFLTVILLVLLLPVSAAGSYLTTRLRAFPWFGITNTFPGLNEWASRKSGANRVASALRPAITTVEPA
jgi:hypothetical protein